MRRAVAAALWALLLGFALAEGAARLWLVQMADEDAFRRYASIEMLRDRTAREGASLSVYEAHRFLGFAPARGYRRGGNHHDLLGFRGEVPKAPKAPGEFRIACLGGSTTYGTFIEAPEDAYPAQLEAALRRSTRRNIRVVNAGASGYTTLESLINLETRVLDLDPDLVIVYHNINDLGARMVWPPSAHRGDHSGVVLHAAGLDAAVPWPEQIALVRIFLVATGRIRSHLDLAETLSRIAPTHYFFEFAQQKIDGSYPSGLFVDVPADRMLAENPPILFRRNLENIVAVARAQGIVPVLATFAWTKMAKRDTILTAPEILEGMREQNDVVRAIGRDLQVPVYDFAAEMPTRPRLFEDAVHVSAAGSRLQGRLFAEFLLREGLVPGRP